MVNKDDKARYGKKYRNKHRIELAIKGKKYRDTHKNEIIIRSKKYCETRKNRKQWCYDLLKTKHCENPDCKWTGDWKEDYYLLQAHHVDPKTKKFAIGMDMYKNKYSRSEIEEELKKCVFLCPNCHLKETIKQVRSRETNFKHTLSQIKKNMKGRVKSNLDNIFGDKSNEESIKIVE